MKKRNFLLGMIAFLMMFATSCSNDLDSGMITTDGTAMVSFSVETPQIASRAYDNPLQLQYAVYTVTKGKEGVEVLTELEGIRVTDAVIEGGSANIKLHLIADKTYKIIFWAAGENAPYAVDFEKQQVVVNYANAIFNDASADAFFACHEFTVTDAQTESVTLIRPMAQLNIGTADLDVAANLGFAPEKTEVKVTKVPTTLNLLDGTVTGETDVTFTAKTNSPKSTIDFPVEGFDNLSMSYVLVGTDKKVVDIEFTYYLGETEETRTIGSVPLQRNYRTNIYGNVLTKEVDVNIDLEDFLGGSDIYANWYKIEDEEGNYVGVRADAETFADATSFSVESAEGLKWVTENVEAVDGFAGKTIVLTSDIDLTEENWNPIGDNRSDDSAFKGTFDGQNHTIKGAHITGDHCFNGAVYGSKEGWGLFSVVDGATIKRLKVDGATFGSYTVITGTIAGYANNTTFEDIEISNTKIAGYNWYTGGVVGWAAGECTFKGINLANTVAVGTLWDSHGQNAGGIAGGVSASAKITIEDCNIACVLDVINDVTSNYKWYIYRVSGMIIGNTNTTETKYNEVVTATATNVTCKNVTVTYGKWMNYHYCQGFWNRGWGRYESSDYIGGVDEEEPHNHADGESHLVAIPFDQLFGGSSNGSGHYPVKGLAEFPGVTVNYPAEYTCSICGEVHNADNNE